MGFYEGSDALAAKTCGTSIPEHDATKVKADGALRSLPSFLVVGPPRTGTTWLHEVLSHHAQLPHPTKETRFFDRHFDKGIEWYVDHFPEPSNGHSRGEIAPTYFASQEARERIAEVLPGAKIVFIFRHPVERLVSLYRLKRAYGMLGWTLDAALDKDPELVESSQYATQLVEWQRLFPADQLSVHLYDDLRSNSQAFVDRIVDFVGVPRFSLQNSQRAQVAATAHFTEPRSYFATRAATAMADWCKARRLDNVVAVVRNSSLMRLFLGGGAPFPDIPPHTMARISSLVVPEVEQLEVILGRDLSAWKLPPAGAKKKERRTTA